MGVSDNRTQNGRGSEIPKYLKCLVAQSDSEEWIRWARRCSAVCFLSFSGQWLRRYSVADEGCVFGTTFPTWQGCLKRTVTLFVKCVPLLIRWVSIIRETCLYGMGFTRRTISNLRNFLVVPWRKLRKNESIKARDAFAFAMISVVNRLPLHSMSTHAQSRFSLTTFPPQDTAFDVEEPYFRREPSVV